MQLSIAAGQGGAGDAAADDDDDKAKKDWKFGRNEGEMTWPWKLCSAILYMLPWVDVTEKTVYFIERFPVFHWTEYFTGQSGKESGSAVGSSQQAVKTGQNWIMVTTVDLAAATAWLAFMMDGKAASCQV
jgi:hypothetical protein